MSWQSKVLGLCKKYGSSAKFAATTILGIVPGGAALTPLIEKVFDTAQQSAQDDWEQNLAKQVQLTAENVSRLDQILELLGGDLQHLMAQMASLQQMPAMARNLLEIARDNDDRAKAALGKLDLIVHRFDRLESQGQQVLAAQQGATVLIEEILLLVRRLSEPRVTEAQIQTTAAAIIQKKHALGSEQPLLDQAATTGMLILSNDDVDLLFHLKDQQRETIRQLYAPCCNRLTDRHYSEIWRLKNLEVLDLSSCSITHKHFFEMSRQGGLPALLDLYLRSCRRFESSGLMALQHACENLECLYLDDDKHLHDATISMATKELYRLRLLSVVGCTGIDREKKNLTFRETCNILIPNCEVIGP